MANDFQNEIDFLGIENLPAFVRKPERNGCADRFMRPLKENLLWVRHFETIEEMRTALVVFQRTYNSQWLLQRHNYRTPNQVFADLVDAPLASAARTRLTILTLPWGPGALQASAQCQVSRDFTERSYVGDVTDILLL